MNYKNIKNDIAILLAITIVLLFFFYCWNTILPFLIGGVIAYLLKPLQRCTEYYCRIPRSISILIIIALLLFITVMFIYITLPLAYREALILADRISSIDQLALIKTVKSSSIFQCIPPTLIESLENYLISSPERVFNTAKDLLFSIAKSTSNIMHSAISIILAPFIAYHIMCDEKQISITCLHIIPRHSRNVAKQAVKNINRVCSAFLRGQCLIVVIWSLYYCAAFNIIGLNTSTALGIFSGLSCIIPYIGALFSLLIVVISCVLQYGRFSSELVFALAAYGLGHIIDMTFVSNKFIGKKLGLHPLLTIFSLLFSASFFGILGMFIAIPAMVLIKDLIISLVSKYQKNHKEYCNNI